MAIVNLPKRKKDLALDSLNATASCFDRLFGHIAPVISPISSSASINESLLAPSSIEWIQHLSRGLITAISIVNEIDEESPQMVEDVKSLREKLAEEQKRCHLLQDFLINELANSDSLATEVRNLKESLSSTIKQRDNLKEKCDSQIEELQMLAAKSSLYTTGEKSGASAILSQSLLGKYIKKTFKGHGVFYAMVVGYLAPYYKLVYEDGDSEEMTRSEVLSVLCTDEEIANLSPSKTAAIAQISSEFDFKNPDACFRGMLNNRPTGDVDSSLGFNSVTSTPSHSFVAIKNESDADENYESSEEREAGGLRRDDCGRFLSTRKARRYSHSDHGSEDTTDGNSSIQNGKRRRRRTSTSNPIFGKRRKRTSSNSKCSISESPSDNPSYMNAIDCTTPPLMTPVQVKGDSPQRRSDSVSESVISGLISISTSSETSPVISISNDSENASVEIIDCQ